MGYNYVLSTYSEGDSMRFGFLIIVLISLFAGACAQHEPSSPKETFKTYTMAISKNDTATMKMLLSAESLKMHEDEAKAQGVAIDDIVKRESLFTEGQKKVEFKDEKIDGTKATLVVKDPSGTWQTVPFVFEDSQWKIDKKNYVSKLGFEIEEEVDKGIEDAVNQGRIP